MGVEVQGLGEVGDGLIQFPLIGVGQAPVDISPGVVGFDLQGLVIIGQGCSVIPLPLVGQPPVLIGVGLPGSISGPW